MLIINVERNITRSANAIVLVFLDMSSTPKYYDLTVTTYATVYIYLADFQSKMITYIYFALFQPERLKFVNEQISLNSSHN